MSKRMLPGEFFPGKGAYCLFLYGLIIFAAGCQCTATQVNLVPRPAEMEIQSGYFKLGNKSAGDIDKYAASIVDTSRMAELGPEGYCLAVSPSSVKLTAATEAGIFYGKCTLEQLATDDGIPCVQIKDRPRFSYRGMHMDVSRHFFSKKQVLKMLDEVARYKLNIFHFHLTDNGGWRIQIDKYPLLTAQGAFRTQQDWYQWWDKNDRHYLPEGTPGAYGGYYTKDDIREIVAYAEKLHITVIPEIEFPAHSDAVFIGYPELCCTGKPYTSGEFCVANEQVYVFMEDVLTEIMELFPSKYLHIGGDEARKIAWKTCPKCQGLIRKERLEGVDGLQRYMIDRIQRFLASKGKAMIGWDEILHNDLLPETVVMSYRGQKGAIEAANRGHYAVMTPGEILYFDWYQADPSTEQRAMYGYSPIKKMYSIQPVPSDLESAVQNEEIIQAKSVDPATVVSINPDKADRIIGVQGCSWAEYIEDAQQLEYMVFPRLLAVAEVAWTPQERRDWPDFKTRMNAQIPLLQKRGINTFTLSDEIEITTRLQTEPGTVEVTFDSEKTPVEIRYTLDGTLPTIEAPLYGDPFSVNTPVTVKAAVFRNGVIQKPVLEQVVNDAEEIRNYYPFNVPEIWKEYLN